MNKARRKKLCDLREQLSEIKTQIEELRDEEQECFDNLPESIQDCERGEAMSVNIETLDTVIDVIDEATEHFEELKGGE